MCYFVFDDSFYVFINWMIDVLLVIGLVLFGIGWGIGGFCLGLVVVFLLVGFF